MSVEIQAKRFDVEIDPSRLLALFKRISIVARDRALDGIPIVTEDGG